MELAQLTERAMRVREQYAAYERVTYGREWTDEEIALGFIGDVGDLMKLVQARNGVRAIPDREAKLAHELADCLWCVLILANAYGIDLERAFLVTMHDLETALASHRQA
jgi:NTP pyrophosphatase (non-canonical NTP hydrolase)